MGSDASRVMAGECFAVAEDVGLMEITGDLLVLLTAKSSGAVEALRGAWGEVDGHDQVAGFGS